MKKTLYPLILVLLCSGCQMTKPHQHTRQYTQRIQTLQNSLQHHTPATGIVKGQLFLKNTRTNIKHLASHTTVILNPVNPESQQWYQEVCKKGHVLIGSPSRAYTQALIQTRTNQQGEFQFRNVPTGEYYLVARAYWLDQKRYTGPVQYGGLMAKHVFIKAGEQIIELDNQSACSPYFYFF